MLRSDSITNLLKALITAKSKIENPRKIAKKNYYSYAPLEEVLDKVEKHLGTNGLVLSHDRNLENKTLVTYLFHESGEYISTSAPLEIKADGRMSAMQAMGAASTYAMRYNICALLSLCGEEDTDAEDPVEYLTKEHISHLQDNWPADRLAKALSIYGVSSWEKFPKKDLKDLLDKLNKGAHNAKA